MKYIKKIYAFLIISVFALSSHNASAATVENLNQDTRQALERLVNDNPIAKTLSKTAKAILVFPSIVKAGLIFGGSYGEGALYKNNKIDGYYNSVSATWGLQAGAQSYGYIVFLMSDKSVEYVNKTNGWEIGVGPTIVFIDKGRAKNLSSSTLKDDAYGFIFGQQGLMAGVSIEGTKISPIKMK
jgi:lipid-binding SYLF domain-containing protein